MTAQLSDFVDVDGVEYALAGVSGSPLFEPKSVGLKPRMISTACWRGYVCWYAVHGGRLVLSRLLLGPGTTWEGRTVEPGTQLLGRTAARSDLWFGPGCLQVSDLALGLPFNGGLLIGRDFVTSTYVHMGFHPAWQYEVVMELVLADGVVSEVTDRSAQVADVRRRVQEGELQDPDGRRGGTDWVARTFTLDYSRSIGH